MSLICKYPDCNKIAVFNTINNKKGMYCATHKLENMVNVRGKPCKYNNCRKQPNYNFNGEKSALYCSEHKLPNMIDIRVKKCIFNGCKIKPNYNYEYEKKSIYCFTHKLEGMIDVSHKKCIYPNCKVRPSYNYEDKRQGIYCSEHKLDGMVNVVNKTCIYPNCTTIPIYNYKGETKRLYCCKHKLDNMVSIGHEICKTYLCNTIVQKKYEGYCLNCFINLFPNKPNLRNYKTKEKDVIDRIIQAFPDFTWVADKKVEDGCSKRRPDLLLDMGSHIIIIEVDENKHNTYDCSCENKRLMEISQDLQHRPIVFIRFNPDSYINEKGETIKSCWTLNKQGILQVTCKNKKQWEHRINCLKEQVEYWINNLTEKTIEIIELFY